MGLITKPSLSMSEISSLDLNEEARIAEEAEKLMDEYFAKLDSFLVTAQENFPGSTVDSDSEDSGFAEEVDHMLDDFFDSFDSCFETAQDKVPHGAVGTNETKESANIAAQPQFVPFDSYLANLDAQKELQGQDCLAEREPYSGWDVCSIQAWINEVDIEEMGEVFKKCIFDAPEDLGVFIPAISTPVTFTEIIAHFTKAMDLRKMQLDLYSRPEEIYNGGFEEEVWSLLWRRIGEEFGSLKQLEAYYELTPGEVDYLITHFLQEMNKLRCIVEVVAIRDNLDRCRQCLTGMYAESTSLANVREDCIAWMSVWDPARLENHLAMSEQYFIHMTDMWNTIEADEARERGLWTAIFNTASESSSSVGVDSFW